jgi:hypothetical protein
MMCRVPFPIGLAIAGNPEMDDVVGVHALLLARGHYWNASLAEFPI